MKARRPPYNIFPPYSVNISFVTSVIDARKSNPMTMSNESYLPVLFFSLWIILFLFAIASGRVFGSWKLKFALRVRESELQTRTSESDKKSNKQPLPFLFFQTAIGFCLFFRVLSLIHRGARRLRQCPRFAIYVSSAAWKRYVNGAEASTLYHLHFRNGKVDLLFYHLHRGGQHRLHPGRWKSISLIPQT